MSSRFDTEDELDGADLSELMDRSLSGLHLDPDALASGAMGAGRPLRRRRRLIAVAASVAAFGLVGAAGAYAINGLSTTRDQIVEPAKSANPSPSQAGEQRQLPARVAALRLSRASASTSTRPRARRARMRSTWVLSRLKIRRSGSA